MFKTKAASDRTKVKVKFLHAGDRRTVFGRGAEGPGFQSADHTGFDTVTQRAQNGEVGDLAVRVNGDIDDYVTLHATGEYREIGSRLGSSGESYLDRARAPGVGAAT